MPRGSTREYDQYKEAAQQASSDHGARPVIEAYLRSMFADRQGLVNPVDMSSASVWLAAEYRGDAQWMRLKEPAEWQAYKLQDLWQNAMKGSNGVVRMPFMLGDEEPIATLEGGWTVVRIATKEAMYRELEALDASPSIEGIFEDGDFEAGKQALWIVRNDKAEAELAISLNRLAICDVEARDLDVPSRDLIDRAIMPLVEQFDLRPMKPDSIPGMVCAADGVLHELHKLPDGLVIDGDLDLRKSQPDLERLPKNMTVKGSIVIWQNDRMKSTPENLKVTGDAVFVNCSALEAIGAGLEVGGYSSFEACHRLLDIGDGCLFAKGVHLPENPDLYETTFESGGPVRIGNRFIDSDFEKGPLVFDKGGFSSTQGLGRRLARLANFAKEVVEAFVPAVRKVEYISDEERQRYKEQQQAKTDKMLAYQAEMDAIIAARGQVVTAGM